MDIMGPNGFYWENNIFWKNWSKCQNLVKYFEQFQNKNKWGKTLTLQARENLLI